MAWNSERVFAVSHAATALPLKRQFPRVGLWTLLLAVQAIELLWVVFTYVGVEHIVVSDDRIHLGVLLYSQLVASTLAVACLLWLLIRAVIGDARLGWAVALGVVSHIVLDIIQHEPDIRLLPLAWGPRLGLGLTLHPWLDAAVETAYGVVCWQLFGESWALLAGLLVLNASDLPFLFGNSGASTALIARHPSILRTVVSAQIILSWAVVWALARRRAAQLSYNVP